MVVAGDGSGNYIDGFVQPDWTFTGVTTPAARAYMAMAYDPALDVDVMFGGLNSSGVAVNETWTYCCAPFTWTQHTTTHTPPARYGAAMVFDPISNRMLLIGGLSASGTPLNDVWSYDGQDWTPAASLPAGRAHAGVSYDPVRNKVYLFGGVGPSGLLPDTLAWNGSGWSTATSTGPSARKGAAMAFDSQTGTTVLFGGFNSTPAALNDTWQFNGSSWTQTTTPTSPPARAFMANAYDSAANELVIAMGTDGTNYYNDTWRFDGVTWSQAVGIQSPQGRGYTAMAYHPDSVSAQMYGGYNPTAGYLADQWYYAHGTPLITNELGTSNLSFRSGGVVPLRVSIRNPGFAGAEVASLVDTLPPGLIPTSASVLNSDGSTCDTNSLPACTVATTSTGATVTFGSFNLTGVGTGGDTRTFIIEAIAASSPNSLSHALNCFTTGPQSLLSTQSYYRDQVLVDNPTGYFRLGDTGATAKNTAAGGVDGTYAGTVAKQAAGALAGDADFAVTPDGSSGNVVLPAMTSVAGAGGITLETWAKPAAGTAYAALMDFKNATGTSEIVLNRWTSSHSLALTVVAASGSKTIIAQDGLQPGGWQHVAGTISSNGTMTLYRNGVPILSAPGFAPDNTTYTQNYLGRLAAGGSFFSGGLDEAAVYPTALPQTRLTAHYQAGQYTAAGTSSASLLAPVGATYAKEIRGDLPAAYWRLDEASGSSVYDSSGWTNTGTITGTISKNQPSGIANDTDTSFSWPTPAAGAAITVPDNPRVGLTTGMTFVAWVKPPTTFTSNLVLLAKTTSSGSFYAPYGWWITPGGTQKFALGNGTSQTSVTSPQAVPLDNKWHQLAVTRTGTSVTFYLDGAAQGAALTLNQATANTSAPLYIGSYPSGSFSYQGGLDEIAMYATALSASHIADEYARGTGQPLFSMTTATTTTSSQTGQSSGTLSGPLNNLPICGSSLSSIPLGLEPWWQYKTYPLGAQNTGYVNAADGNLTVTASDSTAIGTHGRLAYAVQRAYNSLDSDASPVPGSIGAGWQLSLNQIGGPADVADAAALDVSNTIDTLTHPIPVTFIDRDGTHHVFTPTPISPAVNANSDGGTGNVPGLATRALDYALHSTTQHPVTDGRTLCADQRYTSPAGVHVSLVRYLALASGVTSCATTAGASVVGYAAERSDRLRYEFGPNGELLAVTDPAGVTLAYGYDSTLSPLVLGKPLVSLGNLRAVYEPGVGTCPSGYGATSLTAPCRGITLTYGNTNPASQCPLAGYQNLAGVDHSICLTDPAGRVTVYDQNLTNQLIRVVNPDLTTIGYSYNSASSCVDGTPTLLAGPNLLCSVTDSNGHTTNFRYGVPPTSLSYTLANYPSSGSSRIVPLLGEDPISQVTDRAGTSSFYGYSTDAATTTIDTDPHTSGATDSVDCRTHNGQPATYVCEQTRYTGIDALGRVAESDQGPVSADNSDTGPFLVVNQDTWDSWNGSSGVTCRNPNSDHTIDNNLCEHKVLSMTGTPDEDTTFSYTDTGQPLLVRHSLGTGNGTLDTTSGHHIQYLQPDGSSRCTDWTAAGSGNVTSTTTPAGTLGCNGAAGPGTPLMVLTDRTQSLTPRGNLTANASTFANYRTSYQLDDNATAAPNSTSGALCPSAGGVGSNNTGVLCELDAPASADAATPSGSVCQVPAGASTPMACSRYSYDSQGQKTSYTTPKATVAGGTAKYTYTYYTDSDRDASNSTDPSNSRNAGGWLKAVTDPNGKTVLFGYDRAGNLFRSYDRDAVTADALTISAFTNSTVAARLVETDYGPYPNAPGSPTAASAPWRWQLSRANQVGSRTDVCPDANGNARLTRTPNGTGGATLSISGCPSAIASPGSYDYSTSYDALDRPGTTSKPMEGTTHPTTSSFDAFGNLASTSDPLGNVKAYSYDLANRLTTTSWTRGAYTTGDPANQCAPLTSGGAATITTSANTPLPAGRILCQSSQTYDGTGNRTSSTDATAYTDAYDFHNTVVYSYDAAHRLTSSQMPRSHTADGSHHVTSVTYTRTGSSYDADGNVLVACTGRDLDPTEGNAGSCGATGTTAYYGTTSSYDTAGHLVQTDRYRAPAQTLDTSTPTTVTLILTCSYYDADGNTIAVQDPNAGSASCPSTSATVNMSHASTTTFSLLDRKSSSAVPRAGATTYTYSDSGDLTLTTNPNNVKTLHAYDAAHRLTDTVVASNSTTLGAAADGTQNDRTHQTYDADGNVIQLYSPDAYQSGATAAAHMISTVYDTDDRPTSQYTPRYDTSDINANSIGGGGADSQTGQCSAGITLPSGMGYTNYPSTVGACKASTSYDYDGRATQTNLPTYHGSYTNRYTATTFTDDGLVAVSDTPDPSGTGRVQRTTTYDGAGRALTSLTPPIYLTPAYYTLPSNRTTYSSYTDDGLASVVTTPPGASDGPSNVATTHSTAYAYDANGQQTQVLDNTAGAIRNKTVRYSDGSTADAVTDPLGVNSDTHYAYDYLGNATAVFSPNATAAGGNAVTSTIYSDGDANSAGSTLRTATLSAYTSDNLMFRSSKPIDPTTRRTTEYGYDNNGNKVSVSVGRSSSTPYDTSNGGIQKFCYATNDRLTLEVGRAAGSPVDTDGSGALIHHLYDADGNPTFYKQGGTLTGSSTGTCPDYTGTPAITQTDTFYLDDSLRTASDNTNTTSYAYNGSGQPLSRIFAHGSSTATSTISRNDVGLQAAVSNSPTWSSDWVFSYTKTGLPNTKTFGSQVTTATYDSDSLLTELKTSAGSTTTSDWSYRYDNRGRIVQQGFAGAGVVVAADTDTYNYAYDGADRVTDFQVVAGGGGTTDNFATWDRDNNRTGFGPSATPSCTANASTTCWTYKADDSHDQVATGSGTRQYLYDEAGRLCGDGSNTYSYDGYDRTTSSTPGTGGCVARPASPTLTYTYDAMDRQTGHATASATTNIGYDGLSQQVAREYTSSATGVEYQLDGDGTPLAAAGVTQVLLQDDGQGNFNTTVSASAPTQPVCTARFDPFGVPQKPSGADPQQTCNSGSSESDLFYAGGRKDQVSGNYQFGSRTYSPNDATFTTPDSYRTSPSSGDHSVGTDPLTADSYTYVNGDPLNLTDPSGHRPICDDGECPSLVTPAQQLLNAYQTYLYKRQQLTLAEHQAWVYQRSSTGPCRHSGSKDCQALRPLAKDWSNYIEFVKLQRLMGYPLSPLGKVVYAQWYADASGEVDSDFGTQFTIAAAIPTDGLSLGFDAGASVAEDELAAAFGEAATRDVGELLRPYGGVGGGHHVLAKAAFRGATGYSENAALALPNAMLQELGLEHSVISGLQQTAYRAFAKSGQTLTYDAMNALETRVLTAAGLDGDLAKAVVQYATSSLEEAGVTGPVRIPWGDGA